MQAMLKNIVLCFSLACMGTPVSMHSCRVCGCVVVPVCLCMRYGLDTGTCVHSSTARGRISKNRLHPTGVCVLSSIFSALWRGWRWSAAGRRMGFKKLFHLHVTNTNKHTGPYQAHHV